MRVAGLLLVLWSVHGCHGSSAGNREVPARLVDPTPEAHAELTGLIARALGVQDVRLAADAFAADSRLVVEQQPRRDLEHGRIMGRDLATPVQFRLVREAGRCVLLRPDTDQRWPLTQVRCVRELPPP